MESEIREANEAFRARKSRNGYVAFLATDLEDYRIVIIVQIRVDTVQWVKVDKERT